MNPKLRTAVAASACMIILILDSKTALYGANEGIRLCVATVIPSLLPFIFLSNLLTSALSGAKIKPLRLIGYCTRMPMGSESLFLIGALGGYPTGAQAVAEAYRNGQLSRQEAHRLLGFCSNAGPAFLFGITAAHFPNQASVWLLWLIHILSAIITAMILPGGEGNTVAIQSGQQMTAVESLRKSVYTVAQICGWIILFRVLITFASSWFLWSLDETANVIIGGAAELSIGCVTLSEIGNLGMRFTVSAGLLGFGGFCVLMQTASCVRSLGLGMYIPGKMLQSCISILLASVMQQYLFAPDERAVIPLSLYAFVGLAVAGILLFTRKREKRSGNPIAVIV